MDIPSTEANAREHIVQIRKAKGLDNPESNTSDLERALTILSEQLYQSATHFLLELIQNADDNTYDNVDPTLNISYSRRTLRFDCNEIGFGKKNVEAICKIGRSTKAKTGATTRYIGEKGIGFKSVFRVSDVVWISSGHYSFKFDKKERLGMITPIWEKFPEALLPGFTSILLQLEDQYNPEELVAEIKSLDPRLLIFLRKLRQINLKSFENDGRIWESTLRRCDVPYQKFGENFIELRHNTESSLVKVTSFPVRGLPPDSKRPGCTESEILLAFPITQSREALITSQKVYAFLPIRDYGFKFLLQADFLLVANREDIDSSSAWNQALLDAIPSTFLKAIQEMNNEDLRYTWIRYLPSRVPLSNLFEKLEREISQLLSEAPILENFAGILTAPTKLRIVPKGFTDENGTPLIISSQTMATYISQNYLVEDYSHLKRIGVKSLSVKEFLVDLKNFLHKSPRTFQEMSKAWHSSLSNALSRIISAYEGNQQVMEAIALLELVVKIRVTTLSIDHPDRLFLQHTLALAYEANVQEAVELLEQVVKTKGTKLAADHPDRLASQYTLAIAYQVNEQVKEAIALQTLESHNDPVRTVAFSPDAGQLASASSDRTMWLSDSTTGAASKMSNQLTMGAVRSSNEEGAYEVSGVHSDSSSEAESVLSVAASASSRSSVTGEIQFLAGREFAELLLDDEELKSMFTLAIKSNNIGPEKFERNFRRLINQYSVELKQEAGSKEQNDAVYLVRTQSRSIVHYVCSSIAPSTYPNHFDRLQKMTGNKLGRLLAQQAVNQYLEQSHATHKDNVPKDDRKEDIREKPHTEAESESESDIDEEFENHETLSEVSRVKEFMVSSTAFSRFRENLRGFVLQDFMSKVNSLIRRLTRNSRTHPNLECSASSLNRLARELKFIPPNEMWLLFEDSLGLSNRFKSLIEDLTHQTWEWWPLKPRRRPLSAGYARLFWNCPCGEVRWEDVPLPFAIRFSKLLKQATNSLSTQGSSNAPNSGSTTQAANSGAGMQPNPIHLPSLGLVENQQGYTSPYDNLQANVAESTEGPTRTTVAFQSLPMTYVLLGVNVGDDIRLAQIEVRDVSHATDDHFFKELRYQYTALRGVMRRWFSIYRYAHCRFVKFEKIGDNEIVPRDEDSIPDPEDLKYQYTPKPIEHMPPITAHEFRRRFYACYNRCSSSKFMLLSAFHRCGRVCGQAQVLSRIPKKTWRLEENGDAREIFWGILAMEDISFLMVSIYHIFLLIPGLIFWFLWLFYWGHGGDLQNASVPFFALLACLPLFWFPLVVKTK